MRPPARPAPASARCAPKLLVLLHRKYLLKEVRPKLLVLLHRKHLLKEVLNYQCSVPILERAPTCSLRISSTRPYPDTVCRILEHTSGLLLRAARKYYTLAYCIRRIRIQSGGVTFPTDLATGCVPSYEIAHARANSQSVCAPDRTKCRSRPNCSPAERANRGPNPQSRKFASSLWYTGGPSRPASR